MRAHDVSLDQVMDGDRGLARRGPAAATRTARSSAPAASSTPPNQRLGIRHVLPIVDAGATSRRSRSRTRTAATSALGRRRQRRRGPPAAGRRRRHQRRPGPDADRREVPVGQHARRHAGRRRRRSTSCGPACPASTIDADDLPAGRLHRDRDRQPHAWRCCSAACWWSLILVAFLFEWRTALISLVAIPLSLVAAVLVLYAARRRRSTR